jgi:hypothetical protein
MRRRREKTAMLDTRPSLLRSCNREREKKRSYGWRDYRKEGRKEGGREERREGRKEERGNEC